MNNKTKLLEDYVKFVDTRKKQNSYFELIIFSIAITITLFLFLFLFN